MRLEPQESSRTDSLDPYVAEAAPG